MRSQGKHEFVALSSGFTRSMQPARLRYAAAVSAEPVDLCCASAVIDLFDRAAETLRASPLRSGCADVVPARGRLIATGDLHDNPMHLAKVMKIARLNESPDTHVVLHEMIHGERFVNGLDFSYRVLARSAELAIRHAPQVHPLLANHELAQMTGSSISKGAGDSVKMFNDALEYVFSDDALSVADAIARYIASFPLALRNAPGEDGSVFVSHSLPAPAVMDSFDFGILDRELNAEDYLPRIGSAWKMVWGRGHTPEQTEILAANWNVKLFIIGHEKAETGVEIRGPRLLVLNTDHERAAVLPLNLGEIPDAYLAALSALPLAAVTEPRE